MMPRSHLGSPCARRGPLPAKVSTGKKESLRSPTIARCLEVPDQPWPHLGVLVGGIVVEDHVDHLTSRHGALDGAKEADALLVSVPVALHAR
jgi:hypothetical protein